MRNIILKVKRGNLQVRLIANKKKQIQQGDFIYPWSIDEKIKKKKRYSQVDCD